MREIENPGIEHFNNLVNSATIKVDRANRVLSKAELRLSIANDWRLGVWSDPRMAIHYKTGPHLVRRVRRNMGKKASQPKTDLYV